MSERALITPRAGMLCMIDMYLLHIYRSREIVREAFGDCQTYRTSLSMQRSASYASSALRLACQYTCHLRAVCITAHGRTRNHNVEGVTCPPAHGHDQFALENMYHVNLHELRLRNDFCNDYGGGRVRHVSTCAGARGDAKNGSQATSLQV